ncbi:MAG: trypsin-like peptidase domain-containing protein [Candidatus Peribacteraceae bacterium]
MKEHIRILSVAVLLSLATSVAGTQLVLRQANMQTPQDIADLPATEESAMQLRPTIREESAIIEAVNTAQDAVVSVIVTKDLPVIEQYYERGNPFDGFFDDSFLNPFEFQIPQYRQKGTEEREVGGGTAFFVTSEGLLLTNKHVVADKEANYTVLLNNGTRQAATVVAQDPVTDIALLQVEGENFPALDLAQDDLQLGQTVIAIGNALGEFRNTVSVGVISGLKRNVTAGGIGSPAERLESIIQTDAAINQGNSGGPLLNTEGAVVGMNTAIAAGAQNIGFAIPASDLRRALESYREHGRILRAFLGVRYIPITKTLQERNNLQYDYGVLVVRGDEPEDLAVTPGSPADKAGIAENDIILEVDGQKLTLEHSLASVIRRKAPGDTVKLRIAHRGEEKVISVTLAQQE